MADIEEVFIVKKVALKPKDFRTQILDALKDDAHKQKSHREYDQYLSLNQSTYLITTMLQALDCEPQNPLKSMAERIKVPNEGKNQTVIGSDTNEMMLKDPLFSQLHPEVFVKIQQEVKETLFKAGDVIFAQGALALQLGLVIKGNVQVDGKTITPGHFIAVQALSPKSSYHNNYVAETDITIGILEKEKLNQIVLESSIKRSYTRGDLFNKIIHNKFKNLSESEILLLSQLAKPVVFEDKYLVAAKSQALDYFVVIIDIFNQKSIDQELEKMHSNLDEHQVYEDITSKQYQNVENAVVVGDVIGVEGVCIGREERRDWICDGIVEGYVIEGEDLKLRGELMRRLKESVE